MSAHGAELDGCMFHCSNCMIIAAIAMDGHGWGGPAGNRAEGHARNHGPHD